MACIDLDNPLYIFQNFMALTILLHGPDPLTQVQETNMVIYLQKIHK